MMAMSYSGNLFLLVFLLSVGFVLTDDTDNTVCEGINDADYCRSMKHCQWCQCAMVPSTCRSRAMLDELAVPHNKHGVHDICHPKMRIQNHIQRPPPTPPPVYPVMFNQSFGSYMVLQMQPASAKVYGTAGNGTSAVKVTVSGGGKAYSVTANLTSDGNWEAMLQPAVAGGDYTITATGTGSTNSTPAVLEHVTFGDVWYCAGQSNMWLPLHYTFHRNYTVANITAGNLDNIRLMAGNSQSGTFHPWMTAKQSIADSNVTAGAYTLFQFSGACWYFAERLSMDMQRQVELGDRDAVVPLGLISTAIGGSMIEEWTTNTTSATCSNISIAAHNQMLWDEKVVPYLSMTMKGFLWYQGENNMHGYHGNSLYHAGYGCQMPTMVNLWRESWSSVPGTTDANAPFGLVALPGSGSEGGPHMGAMRWAQTANYGTLPNEVMPNTFLAEAYDLNDPWGSKTCYEFKCCWNNYNQSACAASLDKQGMAPTACDRYCSILQGTNVFMGGIHPRSKQPVGYRLAAAAMAEVYGASTPVSGPNIAGCSSDSKTLTVFMNDTLLKDDVVIVQPLNITLSPFEVLTNASLFCTEPQMRCTPFMNGTRPALPCRNTSIEYYCPESGVSLPSQATDIYEEIIRGHPPPDAFDQAWTPVTVLPGNGKNSVKIDLTGVNGTVVAIRYAFASSGCCMSPNVMEPCAMEQCPIMGSPSGLPANPFIAQIKNGKCECVAPQTCNL